jgi:integrase/recombinase XerD
MIENGRGATPTPTREALDQATWDRVKQLACARLHQGPRGRTSPQAASRDLALLLVLGDMGLRSEEARSLKLSSIRPKRSDGTTPWLRVHGKGDKTRDLPIPLEVADALLAWQQHHRAIFDGEPLLFPRLGSRRADGTFPDAGGQFSGHALSCIVKPILRAAGVKPEHAHPHVLRHTYGTLFMRRPNARLERLRELMGHASIDTTAVYIHHTHDDLEQAVLDNQRATNILAAHQERRHRYAQRRAQAALDGVRPSPAAPHGE